MDIGALSSAVEIPAQITTDTNNFMKQEEKVTSNVALLFFKSPFVWTFGGLAVSFFIFPFSASFILTTVVIGGMATFPRYLPKSLHYEAAIVDGVSRNYLTKWGFLDQPYYNEIFPGLYLGAMPLKNFCDEKTLIKTLKINAVLIALQDSELDVETLFSSPVQKSDWVKQGVQVCHVSAEDMTELSLEDLHKAADFIKEYEKSIYIHCKAGRGRSVMCLMAYLMKYLNMSYEQAERFVKCKRPIMNLQECQKEQLKEFSLQILCPEILECLD